MIEQVWVGDYVQFSPGEAPPEDWGIALESTSEDREIVAIRGNQVPAQWVKVRLSDLYPVESEAFKESIRAAFKRALDGEWFK
jgi:hypothetical protein